MVQIFYEGRWRSALPVYAPNSYQLIGYQLTDEWPYQLVPASAVLVASDSPNPPPPPPPPTTTETCYVQAFTGASLSIAGWLPVNHGLASVCAVTVTDSNGEIVQPDQVQAQGGAIAVNLSSFLPLSGTWLVRVVP